MKFILLSSLLMLFINQAFSQINSAFQPFNTQGDNLIHVATADFDGIGVKDFVIALTVEGKLIAFQRPDLISNPGIDNRLWEYTDLPSMGIRIFAEDVLKSSSGDEVILPGTDGHIRILSSKGELLLEKKVSTGALYSACIAKNSLGQSIISTAGVDGFLYFIDTTGVQLAKIAPKVVNTEGSSGLIRHVLAGDFDGDGSDEVISFVNNRAFSGNCFFEITDVNTFSRPSYWNGISTANEDDVAKGLGFTDKQLPRAYDMDGDGDEEVVGHWGVLHPENGPKTQLLSTILAEEEKLPLSKYESFAKDFLIQNHGFTSFDKEDLTNTTKYLLQHGVPGDFDNDGQPELFMLYGDDLFLSQYDTTNKSLTISDYTWAHSLYHFTDGARLENRNGEADKMILSGPITGDDHFYLVNLTDTTWKKEAREIYCNGTFAEIETNLDQFATKVDQFSGVEPNESEPIWYLDYFASYLGWEMTAGNIENHAQAVYDAQQEWYNKIGGWKSTNSVRINLTASINARVYGMSNQCTNPNITAEGMVEFCRALAKKEVYFCLKIGHGNHLYMSPENLADCYEASVIDGECYMMARTHQRMFLITGCMFTPHMMKIQPLISI